MKPPKKPLVIVCSKCGRTLADDEWFSFEPFAPGVVAEPMCVDCSGILNR